MPRPRKDYGVPSWVDAGSFRHEVTYSVNSTSGATYGTRGEVSYSSTTDVTLRARVETLGGQEGVYVRQLYPTASHRVTVRYTTDISVRGKFVVGSSTLHILAVDNVNLENRDLECICGEELLS